ncbi:MAG TPA: hypothetical protein PLL28_08015 [Chitinophagales bacterium]|nr:hypothetical protein [Chitinophagales bacterium]HMX03968.1 hypothetical protein [Chitinophagales bacterium]HMZ90159.1 hypothetical protein [Chitinophagales bacterium]HNA58034.1 hypothetical protein [Chitinophagales bacterium]HNF69309.1 hypothetical protein [Chitinophagales bacterium]
MRKLIFAICATLTGLFAFQSASAQLWLMTDGGVFFTKNLVGEGINAKAAWHFGDYDHNMVTFGGGYNLLGSSKVDIIVVDTAADVTDTIESTLTSNVITIDGDYRRYFLGSDADDYFAFYGLGGLSLWMVNTKVKMGSYVDTVYMVEEGTKLVSSNMSVRIPVGFGVDWTVRGRLWWYVEAKLELPITQVNNDFIGNDFGVSYHINTGARILLWDLF